MWRGNGKRPDKTPNQLSIASTSEQPGVQADRTVSDLAKSRRAYFAFLKMLVVTTSLLLDFQADTEHYGTAIQLICGLVVR